MNNFQWIWQYVVKNRYKLIIAMIFFLISTALILVNPYVMGQIVDRVIDGHEDSLLVPLLLVMIGVTVARTITRYIYQILFEQTGQNSLFDLRMDMYDKLHELDFDFFNHNRVGDIMTRMTGDTDAIRHFISWVSYQVLECVFYFIVSILIMLTISWQLTLALVAVTPIIFWLTQAMAKAQHPMFFAIRQSFSRLNSMVEENISGNRIVKAFVREDFEISKFNEHNDDYKQRNLAAANVSKTYLPWQDGIANSLNVIALIFGGYLVIQNKMTLGDLVVFNGYLWMLNQPMRMSGWLINDIERFSASCVKIRQMLATKPEIEVETTEEPLRIKGDVTFKNVTFHFQDDPEHNILTDVSFSAKAGQTIGIIGETGSGKTTLINLISRFYDPSSGQVLIDGQDVRQYPIRQLRDNISMVMQDVFLFSNSITENISFGRPNLDTGYIQSVARVADADGFIERMPEGYETIVGERGVGLSGGQKQRISLARALAKDPAILMLDDTTSAVDMETETKIQHELAGLTTKKTTFIIANRISSVRDADLILLLEKGRIVEAGKHEVLMQQQGRYYDVFQKQLGLEKGEQIGQTK
ncbi:ABC transporter ATP-binding protein [Latilactobacillus fuchuensis]|uniref:ABC transporter n=1 Tax=Latilactobacillus fuchuensis DSM 14340 = JCM 11249 TaxID=1423747 RepID=A0A0R1RX04_9LACO|nr:ABC transporter ATP-binding protein [Latilactobacillus fuchuensis]KRL61568.1 ABC transporter [Latilactobacillus fuchuensis DSM 14340 = JCM 11249]MCP8857645.1 ABC transporter ATP-binding protein/permease [Latilactobacillus fuchuensis]